MAVQKSPSKSVPKLARAQREIGRMSNVFARYLARGTYMHLTSDNNDDRDMTHIQTEFMFFTARYYV